MGSLSISLMRVVVGDSGRPWMAQDSLASISARELPFQEGLEMPTTATDAPDSMTTTDLGAIQPEAIDAEVVEPAGTLATLPQGDHLLALFQEVAAEGNPLEGILGPNLSRETAATYRRDWRGFADWLLALAGLSDPLADDAAVLSSLMRWLALGGPAARRLVERWRDELTAAGRSRAYVNRRLAALKHLGRVAEQRGVVADLRLDLIDGVRRGGAVKNMAGPKQTATLVALIAAAEAVANSPAAAARNRCVLLLLIQNGLRRGEIARLNLSDWDPARPTELLIRGKGRSTREGITISAAAAGAIEMWLGLRAEVVSKDGTRLPVGPQAPLLCGVDRANLSRVRTKLPAALQAARQEAAAMAPGSAPWVEVMSEAYSCCRMDGSAIYRLVAAVGQLCPEVPTLSPHRLRHAAVTALVNAGQDLAQAQAFARHKSPATTSRYFDDKAAQQAGATALLAELTAGAA